MGIRLTQDEAWAEIDRSHTGILTTLRADGSPVTLPVWFITLDRTICFATPRRTKKVARIARDPRGSFLIESGKHWADLRGVHLSGQIEQVEDESVQELIDGRLAAKYAGFRTAPSEMPAATRSHYASRSFYRLVPGPRILSWDNSRISGAGPA